MSYSTRVYRQRNAHVFDNEANKEQQSSFFSKSNEQGATKGGKSSFFQAKLSIGQPNDAYEKEADSVASAVVNHQPGNAPVIQQKKISSIQRLSTPLEEEKLGTNDERMKRDKEIQEKPEIQTMCPGCEKEKKEKKGAVQTKSEGGGMASPQLSSKIESSAGKGSTLPKKTLSEMNHSFGADFSNVNIHTDSEAAQMNKELGAQAFTHGSDIYFNSGKYNAETTGGKELLAHELAHVIQQNEGISKKKLTEEEKLADLTSKKYNGDDRLQKAFDNSPLLKLGECNESVRLIQEGLVADGFQMPKSTKEDGEMDGDFGTETYNTIMNFQTKHKLDRDGIVGRDTMGKFDDLAIANDLAPTEHSTPVTCHPKPKLPLPKPPGPVTGCEMHAVYSNQRTVSFCKPTSCGLAVQFDIVKITKNGLSCFDNFEGKTLNERVSIIEEETTCPTKGNVVTGSCPIEKNGTLTNCTDTYGFCFPKKITSDFLQFGITDCRTAMKQELIIDGKVFETRKILFTVFFDIDFNAPSFISCNGSVSIS
jgi:hypothetical protein